MTRFSAIVGGLLALVVCGVLFTGASAQTAPPWTTLFDGRNLDAFNPVGTANWKIADGVVQADTGTGFLVTKQPYGDFEIKADIWVDEKANSGIFIRCADPAKIGADSCYEVNVYDTRPDPAYSTGAIVDVAKVTTPQKAGGKWNTLEVRAEGPRLMVTFNGVRTVDVQDTKHARGPIGLQYGAGVVKFRNVQIRTLGR
jgi:hypothetical protein